MQTTISSARGTPQKSAPEHRSLNHVCLYHIIYASPSKFGAKFPKCCPKIVVSGKLPIPPYKIESGLNHLCLIRKAQPAKVEQLSSPENRKSIGIFGGLRK